MFELAFLWAEIEVVLGEMFEYFMNNFTMKHNVGRPDENVIEVDCDLVFGDEIGKDMIHYSLECSWTVTKSKILDTKFKEFTIGDKGCFPFIAFFNLNIVIASADIKLGEDSSTLELSDDVGGE